MRHSHHKIKAAGWESGVAQKSFTHPSGAHVVLGPLGWRAARASGETKSGFVDRPSAMAWALGEVTARPQAAERPLKVSAPSPAGAWSKPRHGITRHRSGGSVDAAAGSRGVIAELASGERRRFATKAEGQAWVEAGGVVQAREEAAE